MIGDRALSVFDCAVVQEETRMRGAGMTVMDYRTRDGLAAYGFSIEPHPGAGWRVYIIFIPSCQGNKIPDLPYEPVDGKRATM
jgi:hypothetical protein